jgi:hypothetical protein
MIINFQSKTFIAYLVSFLHQQRRCFPRNFIPGGPPFHVPLFQRQAIRRVGVATGDVWPGVHDAQDEWPEKRANAGLQADWRKAKGPGPEGQDQAVSEIALAARPMIWKPVSRACR